MGYIERKRDRLTTVYLENKDDVYRLCRSIMKDDSLAQEMTQQTFFNYYQHSDEAQVEFVKGYLMRSARNLCYNAIRDAKKEVGYASWDTLDEESYSVVSVEELYMRKETKRQEESLKNDLLERLREENENWYQAINLLFVLQKPHDVVADEMGISKDALYSLLYRARKWLYKNYNAKLEEVKHS